MRADPTTARQQLDAWRAQRADRLDPLRFHYLDALERRTAQHDGAVRRRLDEKLAGLLDAYAVALADAAPAPQDTPRRPAKPTQASPLQALVDRLAGDTAMLGNAVTSVSAAPQSAAFPELPALAAFRSIWTQVRTDSQMRQTLEQVPADAGPLNSGVLVHRAIALMRATAPGYLQHFLSYVDTLSWLERLQHEGVLETRDAPLTTPSGKPARARARKRRD